MNLQGKNHFGEEIKMKTKSKLATLAAAGLIATGCASITPHPSDTSETDEQKIEYTISPEAKRNINMIMAVIEGDMGIRKNVTKTDRGTTTNYLSEGTIYPYKYSQEDRERLYGLADTNTNKEVTRKESQELLRKVCEWKIKRDNQ